MFMRHTSGVKPSLIIVGLGNPGREYALTRHNAGFLALEHLAKIFSASPWSDAEKFMASCAEISLAGKTVLLVRPTTFMNRSGESIRKIVDFYKLDGATQVLIVVDDIDIPLGTHRLRESGGPGTHNGMKSIVEHLGENVQRFRIGIGPKPDGVDLATWVLEKMTSEEKKSLKFSFQALEEVVSTREFS